ncbi:MAG: response regulator, partial [Candidatus Hodarchaeales archaeon]
MSSIDSYSENVEEGYIKEKIKVLHIDDEENLLELSKIFLEKINISLIIETVSSPRKALELLATQVYDIIISDYQMPEISGLDILKYIRQKDENLPFIILTGKGREEIAIQALNLGADFYLQKGAKPTVLYTELNHFILRGIRRRQAEKALVKEKNKFQKYIDIAGVILVALDSKGLVTLINKKGCELLGYKEEEIIGNNWFLNYFPERIRGKSNESYPKVINGEHKLAEYLENPIVSKNGEERIIAWHNTYLTNDSGVIIGTLHSGEDITERRKAEDNLHKSEERYHSIFEQSPITLKEEDWSQVKTYIDSLRQSGVKNIREYFEDHPNDVKKCASMIKILDSNQASLNLYKTDNKEEILGNLSKLLGEENYADFKEELIALLEGKLSYEREDIVYTLTGEKLNIWLKISIPAGYENSFSRVIVSIIDVTEKKQAEKALQESEIKYQSLVENIPAVTWKTDTEGKTPFISSNVEKIYGFTPEEIYDAGDELWFGRIHPEDIDHVKERFDNLFSKKETFDIEYRIKRKDNRWIWLHDKAITVQEEDNRFFAYGV